MFHRLSFHLRKRTVELVYKHFTQSGPRVAGFASDQSSQGRYVHPVRRMYIRENNFPAAEAAERLKLSTPFQQLVMQVVSRQETPPADLTTTPPASEGRALPLLETIRLNNPVSHQNQNQIGNPAGTPTSTTTAIGHTSYTGTSIRRVHRRSLLQQQRT